MQSLCQVICPYCLSATEDNWTTKAHNSTRSPEHMLLKYLLLISPHAACATFAMVLSGL